MTDSFLSRWARVKAQAKAPAEPEAEAQTPLPAEPVEPVEAEAEPLPELPDIESLTKDSDFSPFLQIGVPEHLRKAALSRLWASDPLFSKAEVYDLHMEDYSHPAITEVVKTAWEFGKGIIERLPEQAAPAAEPSTDTDTPTPEKA